MQLPASPRTVEEVDFFVDESPCERCGNRGLTDESPGYRLGGYSARCATCHVKRRFEFAPLLAKQHAPAFSLTADSQPTTMFTVQQLRAIADREMARVPANPTEIETVAAYNQAKAHLVKARIALVELAKFHPDNAALAAEVASSVALCDRYLEAKLVIESKPGALRKPRGLGDRFSQHAHWLARGHQGDGRLVFCDEHWNGIGMAAAKMHAALIQETTFEQIDFSYSELHDATIRNSRFLRCDLTAAELDRATLDATDLVGSSLGLASLRGTRVRGGDWQRLRAGRSRWKAEFSGVDLRAAGLRDTVLDESVFERCDLRGADLSRKDMILESLGTARRARFIECDLRGAKVEGWRLDRTVFERCRLHGLIGTPAFEGEVRVFEADLFPAADRGVVGVSWPR